MQFIIEIEVCTTFNIFKVNNRPLYATVGFRCGLYAVINIFDHSWERGQNIFHYYNTCVSLHEKNGRKRVEQFELKLFYSWIVAPKA